jgi:hypothetical protein
MSAVSLLAGIEQGGWGNSWNLPSLRAGRSWGSWATRATRGSRHHLCAESWSRNGEVGGAFAVAKMLSRSALRNCPVVACCASMADLRKQRRVSIHPTSTSTSFVNAPVGQQPAHSMRGIACGGSSSDMANQQTLGLPKTCGSSLSRTSTSLQSLSIFLALFLGHFLQ